MDLVEVLLLNGLSNKRILHHPETSMVCMKSQGSEPQHTDQDLLALRNSGDNSVSFRIRTVP